MSALVALVSLLVVVFAFYVAGRFVGVLFAPFAPAGDVFHFVSAGTIGVVGLLVGLLLGALAIHGASLVFTDEESYLHALFTAVLGEAVLFALGWIPFFGPILALVGWFGVLKWRYEGGWLAAGLLGVGTWLVALVLDGALDLVGLGWFRTAGIPGI
ncbi:hypothetical protein [Halarchaeum sp. P4]|uniref:hypothetical protein n=1 Tax=Halarchaeum sp. P4 TaxID=3421639 RepID=UPI003EBD1DFE